MKITDSRLDSIRSLVKKMRTEKADGTSSVSGGDSVGSSQAQQGVGQSAEISTAGYGELHHSIEEKQLARDVQLVLQGSDPAREARLDSLRSQIQAGTYSVEAESIAERMMASGLFSDEG